MEDGTGGGVLVGIYLCECEVFLRDCACCGGVLWWGMLLVRVASTSSPGLSCA